MTLASIFVVNADSASRARQAYGLRELRHEVSETSDAGSALAAVRMEIADLFIVKPTNMAQWPTPVDACLHRAAKRPQSRTVSAGGISVDTVGHRVSVDGEFIPLAPGRFLVAQKNFLAIPSMSSSPPLLPKPIRSPSGPSPP